MKNIIAILILLLTISCSLDRTNPLDPLVSGENHPEEVPNMEVATSGNNIVITWDSMLNVDGYFIYRSQSYDGLFTQIKDETNSEINIYEDDQVDIPGNFYWYKMSAYIIVDGEKLEGYRSEPKTWN